MNDEKLDELIEAINTLPEKVCSSLIKYEEAKSAEVARRDDLRRQQALEYQMAQIQTLQMDTLQMPLNTSDATNIISNTTGDSTNVTTVVTDDSGNIEIDVST